jgi:hypothetical protein
VGVGLLRRASLLEVIRGEQYWGCGLMRLLLEVVVLLMILLQVLRS